MLTLAIFIKAIWNGADRDRLAYWYGFSHPIMLFQYSRFKVAKWYRYPHLVQNILTEWTEIDGQRSSKLFLDIILCLLLSMSLT